MITDRELLEYAAKAAGIELDWDVPKKSSPWRITGAGEDRGPAAQWNPLTDDGDALRLAVKLEIDLQRNVVGSRIVASSGYVIELCALEPDPYAATRRAIVRAAAEIGRAMEPGQKGGA